MKDILQYQLMVSSLFLNASVTHYKALCWLFHTLPYPTPYNTTGASQNG